MNFLDEARSEICHYLHNKRKVFVSLRGGKKEENKSSLSFCKSQTIRNRSLKRKKWQEKFRVAVGCNDGPCLLYKRIQIYFPWDSYGPCSCGEMEMDFFFSSIFPPCFHQQMSFIPPIDMVSQFSLTFYHLQMAMKQHNLPGAGALRACYLSGTRR